MKAIILAGGEGNRLRPLTCDIPKPMVPIMNVPIMTHIIRLLKDQGITEIGVTLMYLSQKIIEYFGDGRQFGVQLSYFVEETPLGTAGCVKKAQGFIDGPFLVVSGDALTDVNLTKAIQFHRQKKARATIVLKKIDFPLQYGVVVTNDEGRIINFIEKPGWKEVISDTVNTGMYILEKDIFNYIDQDQKMDFSRDVFPRLLTSNVGMYGYVMDEYWTDVGDINAYILAHRDFLTGKVKIKTDLKEWDHKIWIGHDVNISKKAKIIAPCVIGHHCTISAGNKIFDMSVIGNNNFMEENVSIKRSIVWNNNYFEVGTHVRGAVIGNKVNIKSYSSIYENSIIGDHCIIGDKVVVKPKVKVWPHKNIESLSTVNRSVIWSRKNIKMLFCESGVSGIINVDINAEFSTRLGAAYGGTLKKGSKVVVSSTTDNSTRMFKYALISGLLSSGIEVYNLSNMLTPMSRHSVNYLEMDGGVHIKLDHKNNNRVHFDFLDSSGVYLNKTMERSVENNFYREDYKRVLGNQIPMLKHRSNYLKCYTKDLLERVDTSMIRKNKLKVLFISNSEFVVSVMVPLLVEIGCEVSTLILDKVDKKMNYKEKLSSCQADFGAFIDLNGETLNLITKDGGVVKDDQFTALTSLIVLKKFDNPEVIVSITAPSVIEKMARKYGGRVTRIKSTNQAVMEILLKSNHFRNEESMVLFMLNFDALAALILITEFIASENKNILEILNQIPLYFVSKKKVFCPWELKGKVMKTLILSENHERIEVFDGVRIVSNVGSVFVLPDAKLPIYRVYSEAIDMESAELNSGKYLSKIKKIIDT